MRDRDLLHQKHAYLQDVLSDYMAERERESLNNIQNALRYPSGDGGDRGEGPDSLLADKRELVGSSML